MPSSCTEAALVETWPGVGAPAASGGYFIAMQADRIIAQAARDMGLWPSKRFSAGYGIWDIREQAYVFSMLPAEEIGVRLTDTFMMVPRKSVSFRINFYLNREQTTRRFR